MQDFDCLGCVGREGSAELLLAEGAGLPRSDVRWVVVKCQDQAAETRVVRAHLGLVPLQPLAVLPSRAGASNAEYMNRVDGDAFEAETRDTSSICECFNSSGDTPAAITAVAASSRGLLRELSRSIRSRRRRQRLSGRVREVSVGKLVADAA